MINYIKGKKAEKAEKAINKRVQERKLFLARKGARSFEGVTVRDSKPVSVING